MKRYRWFARKSTFDSELENGNIGIDDICFVLDRLRLYTRSTSFEFSNRPIYQGETSISDSAGTWTVTIDGITEIYDGLTIKVQLKAAQGEVYSTLNVNSLGAYPVWYKFGIPLTSGATPIGVNSEVTLTYRTVASDSSISIEETSYSSGWVMSESLQLTYGGEFTKTSGTLGLDFGSVTPSNTNKPVTGAAVADSLPANYIESASVSGATLTLETNNNESIVYTPANITGDTVTVGQDSLQVVTTNTTQTITGVKTFTNSIYGDITGHAASATIASRLATQGGSSNYFVMADGSLSNGYDLVDYMADQFSADNAGTLVSVQCSSTVYNDIFT